MLQQRLTCFSKHATKRVNERTVLNEGDIGEILDFGMYKVINRVDIFNKEHRLFYSVRDDAFFVAIQDIHAGTVITVLPESYHDNLNVRVKDKDREEAKAKIENPPQEFIDHLLSSNNRMKKSKVLTGEAKFAIKESAREANMERILEAAGKQTERKVERVIGESLP